jgi:hypothetical protein
MKISVIGFLSVATLAGCATVPPDLQGNFARTMPNDAIATSMIGENVRWGGRVFSPRDIAGASCVEVSTYDVSRQDGVPFYTFGRPPSPFLACGEPSAADHTYDGSLVTFTGAVGTPVVFNVPKAQCTRSRGPDVNHEYDGPYVGAKYSLNGDTCIVTLPRLQIANARVWPEAEKFMVLSTPRTGSGDVYSSPPRDH